MLSLTVLPMFIVAVPKFVDATEEVGGFEPKEGSSILRRPMLVDVDGDEVKLEHHCSYAHVFMCKGM